MSNNKDDKSKETNKISINNMSLNTERENRVLSQTCECGFYYGKNWRYHKCPLKKDSNLKPNG